MKQQVHKLVKIFAPGSSLRRRVAYSLAIVRLVLVPVILLAIYYLFRMGWILDRVVRIDAPAATLADKASIQMMDARRAERNYFLLHDPDYLQANRASLASVEQTINRIRDLEPEEQPATQKALNEVNLYRQRFEAAVSHMEEPGRAPVERIRMVVRAYERDLNDFLRQAGRKKRSQLIDELRSRVGSFDAQITKTVEAGDPIMSQVSADLQVSAQEVLQLASDLERRSWERVQQKHAEAHQLLYRAEWVLSVVSGFVLVLSIWISFILPRQVVEPLLGLKEAVDHAAAGNYEIEFDLRGEGEVVQLANSVRNLIAHVRQKV
ncbi:MAG: hypothetical protein HY236_12215 [Acidobacteria bacterium]|nr:hypothetical protein [Acidobacteriota bacterium]